MTATTTSGSSVTRAGVGRMLRLLGLCVWHTSVTWWSLRSFLFTLVIGQAVTPLLGLLVWSAALPDSSVVSTYYVVLLVVQLMTVSYEDHTLAEAIYAGAFADYLLEPKPAVIDILGLNLALRIWHVVFSAPLIITVAILADLTLQPAAILAAVPAIILAAGLRFVFTYTLALSALWTQRAHGAVGIGETLIFLLGGTAAPLSLLPDTFQDIGQTLPFWSMLGMPAEIAAGSIHGSQLLTVYGLQLGWLFVFCALAVVVWRRGVRRFTFFGG